MHIFRRYVIRGLRSFEKSINDFRFHFSGTKLFQDLMPVLHRRLNSHSIVLGWYIHNTHSALRLALYEYIYATTLGYPIAVLPHYARFT